MLFYDQQAQSAGSNSRPEENRAKKQQHQPAGREILPHSHDFEKWFYSGIWPSKHCTEYAKFVFLIMKTHVSRMPIRWLRQ
jgi:hypothetical protein